MTAFEGISAVVLDMDGVIYRGDRPVRAAARAVKRLRDSGKKLVFSTNNSASTRAAYVRKLARMGIPAREHEIVTSGYATAIYLQKHTPLARIYVVGENGLRSELKRAGLNLVPIKKPETATHVVVGLDRTINYGKIAGGLRALLAGAEFIATNADATYPTERGLSPGAGATVGALAGCSGRNPSLVIGKPSPYMIEIALELLGTKPSETAIVGDRLDTDIRVGKKMGLRTILVLSGACTKREADRAKNTEMAPDFVFKNIAEAVVS
ncbi:MAG: HAD-IIA family hydrolase [Hadesarchaea archaeon]|nr:HAD-IIA family hydrolase [Hadesarchaea archaeon]